MAMKDRLAGWYEYATSAFRHADMTPPSRLAAEKSGDLEQTMTSKGEEAKRHSRIAMQDGVQLEQDQSRNRRATIVGVDHRRDTYVSREKGTTREADRRHKRHQSRDKGPREAADKQDETHQSSTDAAPRSSQEQIWSSYKRVIRQNNDLEAEMKSLGVKSQKLEIKNQKLETTNLKLETANQDLAATKQKLERKIQKLDAKNQKLEDENKGHQGELEHFKSRWIYVETEFFMPYATKKGLPWDDTNPRSVDNVLVPFLQDALEASPLRAQKESLQKRLLANVEKVQTVSDEQLARDFSTLGSSITSFSRGVKIPSDLKVANIASLTFCLLASEVDKGYWVPRLHKKYLIEAFVWSALLDFVFRNPFMVLGKSYACVLSEVYFSMFGQGHENHWPPPTELAERWRYTTMERLVENMGVEAFTQGVFKSVDQVLELDIQHARMNIGHVIAMTLHDIAPGFDIKQVSPIVDKAFALALEMSLQRCRIQVVYPKIGDRFALGETGHLTSVTDSEEVEEGSVGFIVNPGLAKWGDAHGKNLEHRLDLVPSKVFIEEKLEVGPENTGGTVETMEEILATGRDAVETMGVAEDVGEAAALLMREGINSSLR